MFFKKSICVKIQKNTPDKSNKITITKYKKNILMVMNFYHLHPFILRTLQMFSGIKHSKTKKLILHGLYYYESICVCLFCDYMNMCVYMYTYMNVFLFYNLLETKLKSFFPRKSSCNLCKTFFPFEVLTSFQMKLSLSLYTSSTLENIDVGARQSFVGSNTCTLSFSFLFCTLLLHLAVCIVLKQNR